ncbi:MAG: ATP-dependent DNA helicase [Thermoanaerobaculia bacterium]|nr:ATP-dependent DNA helicase [Thermoanaerobaculia bacterium]
MRIDWESRTVRCSVGDLVRDTTTKRIGLDRGEGFRRMWLGREIHDQRADERASSDPLYRAEVPVSAQMTRGDWTIVVSGRIDGLSADPDRRVAYIEEVKSLHFSRELLALRRSGKLQRYLYQLMLYALIMQIGGELDGYHVFPQLVLVDLVSGATEIIDAPFDAEEVRQALDATLDGLVEELETSRALQYAKRSFAEELQFPFTDLRPYQQEMLDSVDRAVRQAELLLVSAPTGIGKTAAAIYPALREALRTGKRLYVLTSKTLQQDLAVETLGRLNDGSFRTLRIRNKQAMCAHTQVICHEDFCPYAARYGEKMDKTGLLDHLVAELSYFDPDEIYESARHHEVCPFEVSLELVEKSDAIVCDYNYVFDPWVGLTALRDPGELRDTILVIDEAHNLLDRARGYFSPSFDERLLDEVDRHLAMRPGIGLTGWESLITELRAHLDSLASVFEDEASTGGRFERQALCEPDKDLFRRQRAAWERLLLRYIDWKIETRVVEEEDPLVDFYFTFVRFATLLEEEGDHFARLVEKTEDGIGLKIFCLDPSFHLASIFEEAHAVVAMSATLEPFEFYRQMLGTPRDRTAELSLPSPFPPENRKIMVESSVETTWKKRSRHYDRIGELVGEIAEQVEGNVLSLFPSYEFLRQVRDRIPHGSKTVLVQQSDMTSWERQQILQSLRDERNGLVLAVSGGMYAEGIDYPGEMLTGVIVVGPALPTVSFERELLRQYFDEYYEAGFEYAYLIPGMTRVIQSAGRLIRSETDRGVIALLCRRFTWSSYNRFFPPHWYESTPRELVSRNAVDDVRTFFEERRSGQLELL